MKKMGVNKYFGKDFVIVNSKASGEVRIVVNSFTKTNSICKIKTKSKNITS